MNQYLKKWYIQILLVLFICGVCLFILYLPFKETFYISLVIPAAAVVSSGIIGIVRLFKKQYAAGICQVLISGGIGVLGLLFLSFHLMFYPYDYFASGLEIPKDILFNTPKESGASTFREPNDFELYESFQPGIYTYDVWLKDLPTGAIYFKAYEVTENTPLSADRLPGQSEIKIEKPITNTPVILSLPAQEDFTIYEGDWGDPYLARFELWFKPDAGGKEKKLSEKIYKIEGWMR